MRLVDSLKPYFLDLGLAGLLALIVGSAHAQSDYSKEEEASIYRSEVDQRMTIRKIGILPISDNVSGIYSRPLEKHLIDIINKDHRWDLAEINSLGPILSPTELREKPSLVASLSSGSGADALVSTRVTKGPNGISVSINMFLTSDNLLFAQADVKDHKRFEINEIKEITSELMSKIFRKIPYTGIVLSRKGTRITLNLGKQDGLKEGQIVSVVQIIKAKRHPKFKFLISTEKEILGRVKVLKVDNTLSFGRIVTERSKGAIQKFAKVAGLDFVKYGNTDSLSDSSGQEGIENRADSDISFGKNPKEWRPKKPPTFGMVGARFGLGSFVGKMNLDSIGEDLEASSSVYPAVAFDLELWVTSKWSMYFSLQQGIIETTNPKSGTDTAELSQALTAYELLFGYNMRFGPSIFSPKVEFVAGYSSHRLFVDDTQDASGNRGLTTMDYGGFKTGILGRYPVSDDQRWGLGAKLFFFLFPTLSESPQSSGTSENTINQFGFFGDYRILPNLIAKAQLDFELYSSSFSGGRASSASQSFTTLWGGVYYMF